MEAKRTRPLPPKGRQSGRACQSEKQNDWWMLNCSLRGRPGGRQIAPITLWYSMRCFSKPWSKGRKRQSKWSTKAANMDCRSWTLRQTYLPSSWWDLRLVRRRSSPSTTRCINSGGYQGLHLESQNSWQRWCPPWKTTMGGNEGKHHRHQGSLIQLMSGSWGAGPPQRKRDASRERSLAEVREPTVELSLQQLPWKRR